MSTLLDRAAGLAGPDGGARPSPIVTPAAAAVRAASGSVVAVLVPVVLAWVLGAGGQVTWIQTVRFALAIWLLAHHTGLAVDGGNVGLMPLGLAALPLLSCWFAGRRLARTMDPRADRIASGASRAKPAMLSRWSLAVFCGCYCLMAVAACRLTAASGLRPVLVQAVLGSAAVSGIGAGLGAYAYRFGGPGAGLIALMARLPERVRPWLRPALGAVALQICAGAVLVVTLIGVGAQRVFALHQALDAGIVGGLVLALGELLLLPNLVLWGWAATAGPGFAVGAGTSVTLVGSTLGPLPAVPVLAGLPAPGTAPREAMALLAVPLVAGVLAGILVDRTRRRPRPRLAVRLEHALGAGLVTGVTAGVLAWLSGGPIGPGRLAEVGPNPLMVGCAVGLEVTLGAVPTVFALTAVTILLRRRAKALPR